LLDIDPRKEDHWQGTGTEFLDPLFGFNDNNFLPVLPVVQPAYFEVYSKVPLVTLSKKKWTDKL
jgi:hypothetical protein